MEDPDSDGTLPGALRSWQPGGIRRLAALIARYGKAIERDLHRIHNGMDLAAEWRSRRWRRLLNLIEGLPRNSAYMEAVTQDEQWARAALAQGEGKPRRAVRMRDWSPEVERLTDLVDRVGELITATIAAAGGKPKAARPAPRPETALDRVRRSERERKHRAIVARVLPAKRAATPVRPVRPPAGPGTVWLRRIAAEQAARREVAARS